MSDHDCSVTTSRLLHYLEGESELTPPLEEAIRLCPACSEIARRAQRLGAVLEKELEIAPDGARTEAIVSSVVSEVARRRRRRLFWSASIVLAASAAFGIAVATRIPLRHAVGVGFVASFILGGPALLVMLSVRDPRSPRVFKRLRGRLVSGVCAGLAEAWRVPVWILRAMFLALLFAKGAGLVLYLLFDLVLPIDAAERDQLLRYRVMRWWKAGLNIK